MAIKAVCLDRKTEAGQNAIRAVRRIPLRALANAQRPDGKTVEIAVKLAMPNPRAGFAKDAVYNRVSREC